MQLPLPEGLLLVGRALESFLMKKRCRNQIFALKFKFPSNPRKEHAQIESMQGEALTRA